jgi:hypothetical protein
VSSVSSGQSPKRRRLTPIAGAGLDRTRRRAGRQRHGALLARLIERQAATGLFSLIQCGASSRLATNDVGKIYFAFYDEPAPKVAMRCNRASV